MCKIADDMANGDCCSRCGMYFERSHGYPVVCKQCYDSDRDSAIEAGLFRAMYKTV